MRFFYSASVMGYGFGYKWHKKYNFANFPRVTRTLTYDKKRGWPFAIIKYSDSVWNKVSLHNMGFWNWVLEYTFYDGSMRDLSNIIVSIAGTDEEIREMVSYLNESDLNIAGIELNFSCPNVESFNNREIPESEFPLYLKLNCMQDPFEYDLTNIKSIRLNSVPKKFGAVSGRAAKEENWEWIKKHVNYGLNVAGCSFSNIHEITDLLKMGCSEIGIGSMIMTHPKAIEYLGTVSAFVTQGAQWIVENRDTQCTKIER
jgi:dihydroorotate dehydrogenase